MKLKLVEMETERTRTGAEWAAGNPMKLLLCYRGLNARPFWQRLVESQFKKLQHLASIASARITLERQREITPAFKVHAWLEVPGPDFHAEARDHTLAAALRKVVRNLERQMHTRRARQVQRRKSDAHAGLPARLAFTPFAGQRI